MALGGLLVKLQCASFQEHFLFCERPQRRSATRKRLPNGHMHAAIDQLQVFRRFIL